MQNMANFGANMMSGNFTSGLGFAPGLSSNENAMNGHTGGPIRRGGGRFNNRSGPYDRNNRNGGFHNRGMANMTGAVGGRMDMRYIAQGGGGAGGKWGDGAGQAMNVIGPKEAVQGRQLRSYEDLDAMPSGGTSNGTARNAGGGAGAEDASLDY